MAKKKPVDFPLEECATAIAKIIANGGTIFQKWTCEKCGDRVTGNIPNLLFTEGHHEDCGHVTDIRKHGCNYMVIYGVSGEKAAEWLAAATKKSMH